MRTPVGFERFARFDGVLPTAEVTVLTVWLRDACGALFRVLAAVPLDGLDPYERSWRHVAAGLLRRNSDAVRALVPESVLLEGGRVVALPPELMSWVAAVGAAPASDAVVAFGQFSQLIEAITARLSPVSDRALRRQLRILQGDLAEVATDVSPVH